MTTPPYALDSSAATTATQITNVRLLTLVRTLWVMLLIFQLVVIAYELQIDLSVDYNNDPRYSAEARQPIRDLGIESLLITFNLVIGALIAAVNIGLSAILMWRSRNERAALFFAFVILAGAAQSLPRPFGTIPFALSSTQWLLSEFGILSLLFLFPDARFTPSWARYVYGLTLLILAINHIFSESNEAASLPYFAATVFGFVMMIRRYRRAGITQRQQMKWLVLVFLALLLTVITWFIAYVSLSSIDARAYAYVSTFLGVVIFMVSIGMPISMGLAIMRYRLWDIDLVINRSLVYGAVTLLLIAVFGGIIAIITALTQGQGQTIGVVVAAVAAMVLFNPARKTIQSFVDHRIYRLRFDLNEVAAAQKKPDVKNPGLYTGRTFGNYEIFGVIGKGGMGEVYKGFGEGRTVAIKVLPEDLARNDEFRKRFTREAQTLSSLDHPNIVKMAANGTTDDGVHYLVMEYIDGQELKDMIDLGAATDYDSLRDWLTSIAAALDYIHGKGLVHRDLKPSNIMLRPSASDSEIKEAVLMDFGIARVETTGTRITGSGAVGTIDYMSPEQIMAAREVDHRSDIYALAIIVYELLTGARPFKGGTGQVLFAHLQQPPPDPRDINPKVPRSVAHAVLKALSKKAEDRFASAGEFVAALE